MIQLRYFASLRETLGVSDEHIELPEQVDNVAALTRWLCERNPDWRGPLSDACLLVAVNQEIVRQDASICEGDEIAWFPPVTGG